MGADTFVYDSLSRLTSGTAAGGTTLQSQSYDPFGNRISVVTDGSVRSVPADPATNRFLGTAERAAVYDGAGNLTTWGDTTYTYDSLNVLARQVNPVPGSTLDRMYAYTADDERLAVFEAESSADDVAWTLRDLDGNVLRQLREAPSDTWTWEKDYVYRGGQVLAVDQPAGLRHAHLDHLGNVRLLTRPNKTVAARHDFHGFGEEAPVVLDREVRFTGHEKRDEFGVAPSGCSDPVAIDNETLTGTQEWVACTDLSAGPNVTVAAGADITFRSGETIALKGGFSVEIGAEFAAVVDAELEGVLEDLDYMHARYCSPWLGRFLGVDPAALTIPSTQPQRWNRYSYALGNPVKYVDPDGESPVLIVLGIGATMALLAPDIANTPTTADDMVPSDRTGERFALGASQALLGPLASRASSVLSATARRFLGGRVSSVATGLRSKAAARETLSGLGLSRAQAGSARSAIAKATTRSTIDILQEGESVVIQVSRAGFDGKQVIQTVVNPDGSKFVTQFAVDAAGKVVHVDPKLGQIEELFK